MPGASIPWEETLESRDEDLLGRRKPRVTLQPLESTTVDVRREPLSDPGLCLASQNICSVGGILSLRSVGSMAKPRASVRLLISYNMYMLNSLKTHRSAVNDNVGDEKVE